MKPFFFALLLILATRFSANASELVKCVDETGNSTVSFTLDQFKVTDLTITHKGIVTQFPELTANPYHFWGRTYYNLNLGGQTYFDFDRRYNSSDFTGEFLLTENPIGLETNVNCTAQ